MKPDATQVFGGRALTQTGMGRLIEEVRISSEPRSFIGMGC